MKLETIDTILPNSPEVEAARMYKAQAIPDKTDLEQFLYDKFLEDMQGTNYDPDDVDRFEQWVLWLRKIHVTTPFDERSLLEDHLSDYFDIWVKERFGW
jgi:hypothetical protein